MKLLLAYRVVSYTRNLQSFFLLEDTIIGYKSLIAVRIYGL